MKALILAIILLLLVFGCSAPPQQTDKERFDALVAEIEAEKAAANPPPPAPVEEVKEEKTVDTNVTVVEEVVEVIPGLVWQKKLNDANAIISPAGFLKVDRTDSRASIVLKEDVIGELPNTVVEYRVKVLESNDLGNPIVLKLYTNSRRGLKIEHSIKKTILTGKQVSKADINMLDDYKIFRIVIDAEEKATLFVNNDNVFPPLLISPEIAIAEDKGFYFEKSNSSVSIDYFYVDTDNDGVWDYKEDWNDLNSLN